MIDWCERTESKVILGATLTSQADGKTSTNALGNVHNDVRHDILVADARQLEGSSQHD
jgi:phage gp29-like protein